MHKFTNSNRKYLQVLPKKIKDWHKEYTVYYVTGYRLQFGETKIVVKMMEDLSLLDPDDTGRPHLVQ